MLKKKFKVVSGYEFRQIKSKARRAGTFIVTPAFDLYYIFDPKQPLAKFGVVIPNAVAKTAVQRNRVKRMFYSFIEHKFDRITPGYQISLYPTKGCLTKTYDDISDELTKILQKVSFAKRSGVEVLPV